MIYRTAAFSMTLNDPYPRFQGHAILWRWISQKRYEIHSLNGILIRTYTHPTDQYHFEWPCVILSDLANIQWHETSRGLSATADLLVWKLSLTSSANPIRSTRQDPLRWRTVTVPEAGGLRMRVGCTVVWSCGRCPLKSVGVVCAPSPTICHFTGYFRVFILTSARTSQHAFSILHIYCDYAVNSTEEAACNLFWKKMCINNSSLHCLMPTQRDRIFIDKLRN